MDDWLIVCERCPLSDCVRPEGSYQIVTKAKKLYYAPNHPVLLCPITQAQLNDWSPSEVDQHIELLPEIKK